MARIVLFGATGYTGELAARALVADGRRPVLAARTSSRVQALAEELGGLEYAVADVGRPESVHALVGRGDVLISTVGPFTKWGRPALEAAVRNGAHYLDSTGEPPFIREVFEDWGPRAREAGCALLPAMGYDYVPGNLAAGLALREAMGPARVAVGYFARGRMDRRAASGGTLASMSGVMLEQGFAYRGGQLVTERPGLRVKSFMLGGRLRQGLSIGGSEHLALPTSYPELRDVDVYLGWFGPASTVASLLSRTVGGLVAIPPVRSAISGGLGRVFRGSSGGPDADARAKVRTAAVAEAADDDGTVRGRAVLEGVNPYDFTGRMLAWAAGRIADGGLQDVGALGPVAAFGLDELMAGARHTGLERVE